MTIMKRTLDLLLLFAICICVSTASGIHYINVATFFNRRLEIEPHHVKNDTSALDCTTTCRVSSWCVSANFAAAMRTCQLLSVEVSRVTSLQPADGWNYMRKRH